MRLGAGRFRTSGFVVEAIFLYNTSEREAMKPRKAFPHPELNRNRDPAVEESVPNSLPSPDAGKPGAPK